MFGVGQRLDFYAGDSGSNTANLTSAARRMSLTAQGRLGIGSDTPQTTLDVAGDIRATGSFILPNNYALVAYDQGHSQTNRSTGTTSMEDDPDNATCRASFANYQRGDIIIFGSSIAMGIALSTNGTNYAGHKCHLRASNGSATIDSQVAALWYRDDNNAIKEVESASGISMVIAADNTTFNNGDTVYAYIRHRHSAGTGNSSTGLSKWGGLRMVWGWHYRKVG